MRKLIGKRFFCIDDEYGRVECKVTGETTDSVFLKWDDFKRSEEYPKSFLNELKPTRRVSNETQTKKE